MRSPVGAITNSVRISARPVSTWVGGTCGVPIALRRIDSTTATRTKQVVISSANGTSDSAAIARKTTSGRVHALGSGGREQDAREHVGERALRQRSVAVAAASATVARSTSASSDIGPSPTPTRKQRPAVSIR